MMNPQVRHALTYGWPGGCSPVIGGNSSARTALGVEEAAAASLGTESQGVVVRAAPVRDMTCWLSDTTEQVVTRPSLSGSDRALLGARSSDRPRTLEDKPNGDVISATAYRRRIGWP